MTAASGAYIPFDRTTTLLPYGTVPVAVARACELTYYCAFRDIHARTDGYRLIAQLVARTLPRRELTPGARGRPAGASAQGASAASVTASATSARVAQRVGEHELARVVRLAAARPQAVDRQRHGGGHVARVARAAARDADHRAAERLARRVPAAAAVAASQRMPGHRRLSVRLEHDAVELARDRVHHAVDGRVVVRAQVAEQLAAARARR